MMWYYNDMETVPVPLETRHMYEDFLYEMENGMYYHFEFESDSISEDDLKRFREYEASTSRIYNAPVITYVICSSGVKKLRDSITEGTDSSMFGDTEKGRSYFFKKWHP